MERNESHRKRLERELVHRYRAQHARDRKGTLAMAMQTKTMRWGAVAVALALGVVACTSPTSTDMEMGKQIRFTVPTESGGTDFAEVSRRLIDTKQVVQELADRGIDDVGISFEESSDGAMTIDLTIWDPDLDAERTVRELTERYAALRAADVDVTPLHTIVEEPLYAKLSRDVFKIEVGGTSDDEIRARILTELAAKGLDDSSVEVITEDGVTTIDMSVDTDDVHTHDVIELKVDGTTEVDVPMPGDAADGNAVEIEEVERKN